MNELALFSGAGGGLLGGRLLGWRTVCAVELDPYAASVLLCRQNDGTFPAFPVWDDVCTFDGRPWRGRVEVISGGFPCQDISVAGAGAGIDGERSGLWSEFARIIGEVRPRFVFVENSPMLTSRGLGTVLGDLAKMGFDAEWGVLGAHSVGAPHKRDRIWIVAAHSDRQLVRDKSKRNKVGRVNIQGGGQTQPEHDGKEKLMADSDSAGRQEQRRPFADETEHVAPKRRGREANALGIVPELSRLLVREASEARARLRLPPDRGVGFEPLFDWWETEPNVGRVADGVASRVDRLKAIGNGQVSAVAALAWHVLIDRLENPK